MMRKPVKYCVVDAFTDTPFKGNPAAVCLLDEEEEERDDQWLQSVASEFNISQTGYLTRISVGSDSFDSLIPRFRLRWFTPVAEVKLCGHATLAAAHFLFQKGLVDSDTIEFLTLSGILTAKRVPDVNIGESLLCQNGAIDGFSVELNFPAVSVLDFNDEVSTISKALNGASVVDIKKTAPADDFLVELPSWKSVAEFQPRFDEIKKCPGRGIIITAVAPSESEFDFVSRFFCPKLGIYEDPVCGSAHCALTPYWFNKLGKHDLVAYQASPRGGILNLHLDENNKRVLLRGLLKKAISIFALMADHALGKCVMKVNIPTSKSEKKVKAALAKIEGTLEKVNGVSSVSLDRATGMVTVIGTMDPAALEKALGKKGIKGKLHTYEQINENASATEENNQNQANETAPEEESSGQDHAHDLAESASYEKVQSSNLAASASYEKVEAEVRNDYEKYYSKSSESSKSSCCIM